MRDTTNPTVQSDINMSFESCHEFKLPSEVDPRKKNGKGGFLEGEIQLPELPKGIPEMKVAISTHPTFDFPDDKVDKYPGVEEFSPCLIYPFYKPKGQILWDKMPIPYLQHWKVELLVNKENSVFIRKNISKLDHDEEDRKTVKNAPDWEEIFKIGPDRKLKLGKDNNKLKVKILYPKTEARSTEGDVTVMEMLKQRGFPPVGELAMEFSEGPKKKNLKECKLLVDIQAPTEEGDDWVSIGRGLSSTIKDSRSLLDIHDLSPIVSCSRGGSKIIMVSESSLNKDVIPQFQLWSKKTGRRLEDKEEEERLLNNEIENIRVQNGWLRFPTPPQPKLGEILSKGYTFKLVAKRSSDGALSNTFDFTYEYRVHDSCLHTVQEEPYSLVICNDCHFSEGSKIPEIIKAKPGVRKRKPAEDEESRRPDEEEGESEKNSGRKVAKMMSPDSGMGPKMMSPDSGMGDSPPAARRESSDSIDDLPFGDIPTQGSGSQVEDLVMDIPVGELRKLQNSSMTADQEQFMKLIDSIDDSEIELDGIPKSSHASASAKMDSTSVKKPKSPRPTDTQPEARQGVLRAFLNAIKNHVVVILLYIMSVLLNLAGKPTFEKNLGKVFSELILVYWPFLPTFALLCFFLFDWTSDICSGQTLFVWVLIVFLAVMLTAMSVRFMTALTRRLSKTNENK